MLQNNKIRAEVDIRNEQISYKVREHSLKKIPYIVAVAKNEIANNSVSVRKLGENKNIVMSVDEFKDEIHSLSKNPLEQ